MGGAVGILSNGLRLLDRLGVYQTLLTRGNTRSNVIMHSTQGSMLGKQDNVSYARSQTGYGYMRIKRGDLVDTLMDEIKKAQIPIHFGKQLSAIHDDVHGVTVKFLDGTTDSGDMLLGCDGIHSQVRTLHVDPAQVPEYSGFSGLFSIIPTVAVPQTTSCQLSGFDVTLTEEGMFAAMLCTAAGDEVYWGVSRQTKLPPSGDTRDGWEVRRSEVVEGFKSDLKEMVAGVKGEWGQALRNIIDSTANVNFYPVYRLPLGGAWSKGRCILLGDAAHAMQPHAGQGVSMALEDVFLLSRLLADPDRLLSECFERFDSIRRPRVSEIYRLSSDNSKLRNKTGPWGLWAKEVAIKVVLWAPSAFGLERFGLGQKHLVYDIDEHEL
jgi:2-polyprenyl-6-methoxyphenol hydroxylase-like FAD-dependent oxidoreductase